MAEVLAEIENFSFRYHGSRSYAVKNVSIVLRGGEYVLLTGPSGCGKSTLCRALNGLIPHFYRGEYKGSVIVAGHYVPETPTYVLARHVGMVFQNPENQLFLSSVEREIAFGLENLGLAESEIERRVKWALRFFGLEELKDKPPYILSGGQQQKVAIASVVVMEPEVLILDEPTANLDPLSAEDILSLLETLRRDRGIAIVLVEHRLEIALRYATRLIVMRDGEVIRDSDPRDVVLSEAAKLIGVPPVVETHLALERRGLKLGPISLTPRELCENVTRALGAWAGK